MAITTKKLSDLRIKQAQPKEKAYKLADGGGLYIEVTPAGAKYWRLKYRYAGKEKRLAIGVYPTVSLKAAREAAQQAKEKLRQDIDPSAEKRRQRQKVQHKATNNFEAVALEWHGKQKNWAPAHASRILSRLNNYLIPYLGNRPIDEITGPELLDTLNRLEKLNKINTAHRVKQLAGQVFRYGIATGRCDRDISADLKGALSPAPRPDHMATITDPAEIGKLLLAMDSYQGGMVVKTALLLNPLLFCRPGELRHLEWQEINFQQQRIEIPAAKMKMATDHIIPLSRQALELLNDIQPLTGRGRYVFPSPRGYSRPMSENAVLAALRTLGYERGTITGHGFRAMARTLLDEELGFRVEWIEQQLAHAVKDANGRAYNRTAHLGGRKEMMQAWADYLDQLKAIAAGDNITIRSFKGKETHKYCIE